MRTAFDLSFQEWEPRLFIRLGSHSLLLDLKEGLFEIDGRPLRVFARNFGHPNPLEGLGEATPLESPVEPPLMAMADAITRFLCETPVSAAGLSRRLLRFTGAAVVLFLVALFSVGPSSWRGGVSWEDLFWISGLLLLAAGSGLLDLAVHGRGLPDLGSVRASMPRLRVRHAALLLFLVALLFLRPPGWSRSASWGELSWASGLVLLSAGLVLQALAAKARGFSAFVYSGLWCLGLAAQGHPWVGVLSSPFIFAAGRSRFLNPWLGALLVFVFGGSGQEMVVPFLLPWLAMAAVLTVQALKRSGRVLPLAAREGMGELARGAEALARSRIWFQAVEGGPLTDAFMLRADDVELPGGLPLWYLEIGADTLTFLPGALLWIREGYKARLVPWEAVRLQSQPCVWQDPPESVALSPEQWMLRLRIPGLAPWTFILGDATWGRRASGQWSRVLPTEGSTGNATAAPMPRVQDPGLLGAYRTLGLSPVASPGQVRQAYRQLAKIHHPDAHPDASPEERLVFEERMQRINEAYACLREAGAA